MSEPLSVTALTRDLKFLLEEQFDQVLVEGEISGRKLHASGHLYFTLKDEGACLSSVMWKASVARLPTVPREGDRVVVQGRITVYEPRGQYQLVVTGMKPKGMGDLQARFEELRRRLEAEGLFAFERKRDLPAYPRRVAVVTSPSGAVFHDIRNVLSRRAPHLELVLVPAPVQGPEAVPGVVAALDLLASTAGTDLAPDVVIVGRGGGSIEDLWAFNEEAVIRALADFPFPVVSAVGHETDVTLCDHVADLRAPTPSAAAELVSPDREAMLDEIESFRLRLREALQGQIRRRGERLELLASRPVLKRPEATLERAAQKLDLSADRLDRTMSLVLERGGAKLGLAAGRLDALSPLKVLARGFAAVEDAAGKLVTSASSAAPGQAVRIIFRDGRVRARIEEVEGSP